MIMISLGIKAIVKNLIKNVFKLILPISMKIMVLIGSIISFSVFKYLIIRYKLCLQTLQKKNKFALIFVAFSLQTNL